MQNKTNGITIKKKEEEKINEQSKQMSKKTKQQMREATR